jgi:predicted metal-binding membrane protein
MASAATLPEGLGPVVRRFVRMHPEAYAGGAVALVWLALLGLHAQTSTHPHGLMAGMDMSVAHSRWWQTAGRELPGWELMVIAMMGLALLPALGHASMNSLPWRRKRAMVEVASAYLAVWTVFGFVALAALQPLRDARAPLAVALVFAALWELAPPKRRALRDCHRVVPLPPRGLGAEVAAFRFGLRQGSACMRSCWPVMLVMALLPMGQLWWMVGLTALVTSERFLDRPQHVRRVAAGAMAIAALGVILVAFL